MTDIVSPTATPPPRRPNKSRLRTLETSSITSSIHSSSPVNSPIDDENSSQRHYSTSSNESSKLVNSPTPSINSVLFIPPEKSKYRSRFTEHFESSQQQQQQQVVAQQQNEDISILNEYNISPITSPKTSNSKTKKYNQQPQQQQQRPDFLKTSKSLNTIHSTVSAPAALKKMSLLNQSSVSANNDSDELNLPLDPLMTTTTSVTKQRVQLITSISTPLQLPSAPPSKPRNFGSNRSVLTGSNHSSSTSSYKKDLPISATPPTSLNRADVIITRLESWLIFLKSVTSWVDEVSKINMMSSRGYYQRAYPFLDESVAVSPTTTTNATEDASSTTTLVQQNVNQSILTVQAGLQVLTMQIAAEQQDFAKSLERDHVPKLLKLRKECKEKIHKLKNDPALALDELLRRAEVTRSKMTHLSRCCKQADKLQGQQPVEMDPWVANLLVLRQLKREVDEENRLRLHMIPIQKDLQSFEARLIDTVKPTVEYCYKQLAPGAWDGSDDPDSAPFQLLMEQVMPDFEWKQFLENHKRDLVNEKNPTKDYLKINYPNKFHPLVMTLLKGKLERKFGVRKQFTERNYVLSQGGYLHQFSMDDKVSPEKTIFIPSCTIIPSIDISHLSNMDVQSTLDNDTLDKSNTFEICRPGSNVLQRDKISVFRTSTREELITWCRLLLHISSGVSLSDFGITSEDGLLLSNASNTFDDLENHPNTPIARSNSNKKAVKDEKTTIALKNEEEKRSTTPGSSPARSLRSVRTEESFNEPAAMSKRRSALQRKGQQQFAVPTVPSNYREDDSSAANTPNTILIPEEYRPMEIEEEEEEEEVLNNADAESFVTARFNAEDTTNPEEEEEAEPVSLDEYFNKDSSQKDDDAVSIASTSTAKGPTSSSSPSNQQSTTTTETTTATAASLKKIPSLASTHFDDAQSSLYFSSTSAPPSPSLSTTSSIISIPDFPSVLPPHQQQQQTSSSNNTRMSAAELYKKATLTMNLNEDDDA